MKKTLLSIIALMLSVGLWAEDNTEIVYTASEGIIIDTDKFIGEFRIHSFAESTGLGSIFFHGAVTEIENGAFDGNYIAVTSITLPSTITTIGEHVFDGFGTATAPVTLTLPDDWNYAAAPSSSSTAWYGGYFQSNIYSTDAEKDKKTALEALATTMGDYKESAYLHSLVAEEAANINNAPNRLTVNENKQAALDKINGVMEIYQHAFGEGKTAAFGDMGKRKAGNAIEVIDQNDKSIILYNPKKVNVIKVTTE